MASSTLSWRISRIRWRSASLYVCLSLQSRVAYTECRTGFFWGEISSGSYDFFYDERISAMLKALTKTDIHTFYMHFISPQADKRSKLAVHIYSQRLQAEDIKPVIDMMKNHGLPVEELNKIIADKPRSKVLREAVDKLLKSEPDLHGCCSEEILRKVDALDNFPDAAKDIAGVEVIKSRALKGMMKLGEAREPFANYYDGAAKL